MLHGERFASPLKFRSMPSLNQFLFETLSCSLHQAGDMISTPACARMALPRDLRLDTGEAATHAVDFGRLNGLVENPRNVSHPTKLTRTINCRCPCRLLA